MKNTLILTDCDGVLLDWESHFQEWMDEKGYRKLDDYDVKAYSLSIHYGIPAEEAKELVAEFNQSSAIGFVPPFRDAMDVVPEMWHKGYGFAVITSLSTNRYSGLLRKFNLEEYFGDIFQDIVCLDVGADKDEELEKWVGKATYFIEDKFENAMAGKKLGFTPLLLKHDHNWERAEEEGIRVFDDWNQIKEFIYGETNDVEA